METQRQTLRGNMDLTSRRASPTWHANGYSTPRRTFPLLYWILFPLDSHPCTNPVTMASCPEKCGGSYSSIGLVIFIPVWWDNPTFMLWPLCRSWACFFLFFWGGGLDILSQWFFVLPGRVFRFVFFLISSIEMMKTKRRDDTSNGGDARDFQSMWESRASGVIGIEFDTSEVVVDGVVNCIVWLITSHLKMTGGLYAAKFSYVLTT